MINQVGFGQVGDGCFGEDGDGDWCFVFSVYGVYSYIFGLIDVGWNLEKNVGVVFILVGLFVLFYVFFSGGWKL